MGTLPRAWKETKLVTKQLVEDDQDRVTSRKALIEARTPAQLSQITSVADFPIPDALTSFLKSSEKKPKEPKEGADANKRYIRNWHCCIL